MNQILANLVFFSLAQTAPLTSSGTIYAEAQSFAFAPGGTRFVAGMADMTVKIYDAKTAKEIKNFKLPGNPFPCPAVAWSPRGDLVAAGAENGSIHVWNVNTGNVFTLRGHIRGIQSLAFHPSGLQIVSTGHDDVVRIWDLKKRKTVVTILGKGINLYNAKFDAMGKRVFCATLARGIAIYKPNGQLLKYWKAREEGVNDVDANRPFTLAADAGRDSRIGIWDLKQGKRISYLSGHGDWVVNVKISPNGKYIASSSSDGKVILWDLKKLKRAMTLEGQSLVGSPLAWSGDGSFLLTLSDAGYIRIWRAK
ncbi:MAG TPA: WD40 repeat domain-containing protein [Fimbriimonadales bacterium]|nr:WD40 repeat domain-containing protein [Fimbriimonadales bacterium]